MYYKIILFRFSRDMAQLQAKTKTEFLSRETFPLLGDSTIIGRHPCCEIVLDHGAVSREHARIIHELSGYYLEDLSSRNGTSLNGKQIDSKTKLFDGDVIRVCDVEFLFVDPEQKARPMGEIRVATESDHQIIIEEDEASEDGYHMTSEISIPENKAGLNSANAEVKLRALIEIGRNLGAALDQVLPQILRNLLKIFRQADCAYIFLIDKQTKRLELRAFLHRNPRGNESLRVSRSVLERVAAVKKAILSDDIGNDYRFNPTESIVNFGIHSVMATPILGSDADSCLGVIQVDSRTSGTKFNYNDLDLLVSIAYQIAVAIENAQYHEVMIQDRLLERELSVAHRVQRGLLPVAPPKLDGYEFYDFYQAAHFLGGDYYDFISLPSGEVVVALGDVSGKGISAALLMAKLSSEVRYRLFMESNLPDVIQRLNETFCEDRWESRFITFFLAIIHPTTHRVRFVNAGHFSPILISLNKKPVLLGEEVGGLPLGVTSEAHYKEFEFTLEPDCTLAMLSDGLTDAMNANNEFFSLEGVLKVLYTNRNAKVEQLGRNLINAVQSFSGKTPQTDDQCLVLFGRR